MVCIPVQGIATRSPVEPLVPDPPDLVRKLHDTAELRRASVVLVMAPELAVDEAGADGFANASDTPYVDQSRAASDTSGISRSSTEPAGYNSR